MVNVVLDSEEVIEFMVEIPLAGKREIICTTQDLGSR